jgi:hypothetical protein
MSNVMKKDIAKRVTKSESQLIDMIRLIAEIEPGVFEELYDCLPEKMSNELGGIIYRLQLVVDLEDYKKEIEV